jgi:hypothetical protein
MFTKLIFNFVFILVPIFLFCSTKCLAIDIWVNDGLDKVTQDELRKANGKNVTNSVWDGNNITLFGAKNEVVSFNIIIESAKKTINDISIKIGMLYGPNGSCISNNNSFSDDVFDYRNKNIEIFYVRYLKINGISFSPSYDERHIPKRFQLPYSLPKGKSYGFFDNRPDANKYYPDIAVPFEVINKFSIKKGCNQSIWVDIYIPKKLSPGLYKGNITITKNGIFLYDIPIKLNVYKFSLSDNFNANTMIWLNYADINERYTKVRFSDSSSSTPEIRKTIKKILYRHHQMAKRHRMSLISDGIELFRKDGMSFWDDIFNGNLFSENMKYSGPGKNIPGKIYSIGTYGCWRALQNWDKHSKLSMWKNSDKIVNYFTNNYPHVLYFLYLLDEPSKSQYIKVEKWAKWIKSNPGVGNKLKTFCTTNLIKKINFMPSIDIAYIGWGDKESYIKAINICKQKHDKIMTYNGWRPSSGTFMIDDDGVALVVNGWIQFKHHIDIWFYWAGTNYRNPSRVKYLTNVFKEAVTFGRKLSKIHPKYGETGIGYANGDGVLFYPGTDNIYPEYSYNLKGPIASLRLKYWRRGLQDYEYLLMASKKNQIKVRSLINKMIPKTLWELGVSDKSDPTYIHTGISWPTDPSKWEIARRELASIICN